MRRWEWNLGRKKLAHVTVWGPGNLEIWGSGKQKAGTRDGLGIWESRNLGGKMLAHVTVWESRSLGIWEFGNRKAGTHDGPGIW